MEHLRTEITNEQTLALYNGSKSISETARILVSEN